MDRGAKKWLWTAFAVYCAAMAWLLFGQRLGAAWMDSLAGSPGQLNLRPFAMIRHFLRLIALSDKPALIRSAMVNLAGNVAVFVPMGVFLPLLWRPMRKLWLFLPAFMALIAAVEGVQYVTALGVCDVDDLILNTAGGLIGWAAFMLARCMHRKQK